MRNALLPCLISGLLVCFAACEDKKDPVPAATIDFSGLTLVDDLGQALSSPDADDWRTNDTWSQAELDLFDGATLPLCGGSIEASPAFPNPCDNVLGFRFVATENSLGYFRVVDEDFNVLLKIDSVPYEPGTNFIQMNVSAIQPDTVRLYYRVIGSTCESRGHEDVLVQ